jgi:hypothetical protein
MYRDENNITHLGCEVVRLHKSECEVCERPLKYRPIFKAPTMCKSCVGVLIDALHDPEAEAAVVSMAKMGRTDMDTITVDVKLDDDADRVRCIVEVTDKLRDLAQALMQTEIIHY